VIADNVFIEEGDGGWLMALLYCCSNEGNRGVHWEISIVSVQAVCQYAALKCSVIETKFEHQK